MGFCISNQLIWFSSKSVICDPPDTADAKTVASSKSGSASNSSKNRNKFCGIHPRKREGGLHPTTEERFWCGLEAVQEVTERPGQLGLQVQTIFRQY